MQKLVALLIPDMNKSVIGEKLQLLKLKKSQKDKEKEKENKTIPSEEDEDDPEQKELLENISYFVYDSI